MTENLAEEPGGGDLLPAPGDDHPLGHHRQPRQRRRRRRLRAPRRLQVYDSIISNNLVDGSGGALGSTGDILVVRSHVDGNTTDGDGGAIYTDEDGDVTVIDSTVDGNTADGPGGAIFTLEGDVTIVNSTLNGNRADDRGGAISGEADVTVIDSTIARNAAVAHVGGGIWVAQRPVRRQLDDQQQLRRGRGRRSARRRRPRPGQLDRHRQRRPGRRERRRGRAARGLRLDHRPGEARQQRRRAADRQELRRAVARSFGYNFVSGRLLRPERARATLVGMDPSSGPLADNGGRARRGCRAGQPGAGLDSRGRLRFRVRFRLRLEGEQHLAAQVRDLRALMRTDQRGVRRGLDGTCDAGAVEVPG